MGFESIDASKRATARAAGAPEMAYYGKTAQFRLNSAAMNTLTERNGGNPVTKITVMHDAESNLLGFAPAPDDSPTAAKLSADNPSAASRYFGFRGLALKAGLSEDTRWMLPVEYDKANKLFVVNLNDREELAIVPRAPRGSKTVGGVAVETSEEAPADEASA